MTDNKPAADVTKDWQATQAQKSAATRLRLFAALSWIVAIGGQIAGVVLLYQHKFDHGNLPLLIGILVGIAIFAIAGNLLWKAANRHDPARASDTFRFFFQNQLGVIITLIAFLPLVLLIFTDKNMDPQTKKVAGGVGAVLAVIAALIGVSYNPPSVEQYTEDMNTCAAQIKAGQPTTACSPDVAAQAQEIATDSATVAAATKDVDAVQRRGQDLRHRSLAGPARAHEQVGVAHAGPARSRCAACARRAPSYHVGEAAGPVAAIERVEADDTKGRDQPRCRRSSERKGWTVEPPSKLVTRARRCLGSARGTLASSIGAR